MDLVDPTPLLFAATGSLEPPPGAECSSESTIESTYLRYAPILRRVALRRYEVPIGDVDALVNDVFATLITNPSVVRDIRSYLIGGICNAARDYWRERHHEVPLEFADGTQFNDAAVDGLAQRLAVSATLARMRARCREVLKRYYFEGEKKETIAAAIGTSPDNVLYLLHVCRRRARKIYDAITQVR
jgi:RNA polymerase sigma factor (sigma-70 family)